jgi:hypothetical protein
MKLKESETKELADSTPAASWTDKLDISAAIEYIYESCSQKSAPIILCVE